MGIRCDPWRTAGEPIAAALEADLIWFVFGRTGHWPRDDAIDSVPCGGRVFSSSFRIFPCALRCCSAGDAHGDCSTSLHGKNPVCDRDFDHGVSNPDDLCAWMGVTSVQSGRGVLPARPDVRWRNTVGISGAPAPEMKYGANRFS